MSAGGKREGAGRKKAPESLNQRVTISLCLPRWLVLKIRMYAAARDLPTSRFVEALFKNFDLNIDKIKKR